MVCFLHYIQGVCDNLGIFVFDSNTSNTLFSINIFYIMVGS